MKKKKRFLLAVDRYDQSFNLIRYFRDLVPPENCEVVLFHVSLQVPDTFFDAEDLPRQEQADLPIAEWRDQEKRVLEAFLESAKKELVHQGFAESAVTIKHQLRKVGIARDIFAESVKGYDAMLIGRSETHDLQDASLGSVTTKLVNMCTHLPLGIVHGPDEVKSVLIGIDSSEGAFRCIPFMADIIANPAIEITLCHVIRSLKVRRIRDRGKESHAEIFSPEHILKWQLMQKEGIRPVLDKGIEYFVKAGWPEYRLHTKVILDVENRAHCLVDELRNEKHSSILLGRRGMSIVKEFFMGRVGLKVLNMVDNHTVWIIN